MTLADYTETPFARVPRLHHKDASQGPSSAGFGKRNLVGMMGVMMSSGAKAWTNPYVTDGLIAMWDGEWNSGGGVHDANATKWSDLCGTVDLDVHSGSAWTEDGLVVNESPYTQIPASSVDLFNHALTVEQVFVMPNSTNRQIFSISEDRYVEYVFANLCYEGMLAFYRQNGRSLNWNESKTSISSNTPQTYTFARDDGGVADIYRQGVFSTTKPAGTAGSRSNLYISFRGHFANSQGAEIKCTRVYSRKLTQAEVASNFAVDKARFGLT